MIQIENEFKNLIPPISPDELKGLEESIIKEGCRDPLVLWDDIVLDGHNRLEICQRRNIPFQILKLVFPDRLDAMIWIRRNQASRRNLTDDQRAMNAAELAELESEKAKRERAKTAVDAREIKAGRKEPILETAPSPKIEPKERSRKVAAKSARVSERKVRQAQEVKKVSPEMAGEVMKGDLTLSAAVREIKRKDIVKRLNSIEVKEAKVIEGVYDVIIIDPPWPMKKIERDVRPNQSEMDYPTMPEEKIHYMEIPHAKDCHLFVWTPQRFLPSIFQMIKTRRFTYVCTFVWHKSGGFQPIGLPQYNCEFIIYCKFGKPQFIDTKAFSVCFNAQRGGHSEKPEYFYSIIRRVTAGRRLDMFNRRPIEGFDGWGKEAG